MFTDFDVNCVCDGAGARMIAHELVLTGDWLSTGREIPGAVLILTGAEWDAMSFADDDWVAGSDLLKGDSAPEVVRDWVKYVGEVILGEGVPVV